MAASRSRPAILGGSSGSLIARAPDRARNQRTGECMTLWLLVIGPLLFLAAILHNAIGYILGYWGCRLTLPPGLPMWMASRARGPAPGSPACRALKDPGHLVFIPGPMCIGGIAGGEQFFTQVIDGGNIVDGHRADGHAGTTSGVDG